MKIGFIGLGVVGGALYEWVKQNTQHDLAKYDPAKGFFDELTGCNAIFIAVPTPAGGPDGTIQDLSALTESIHRAKEFVTDHRMIFVRSSVVPGTCDAYGVTAMPEFLTERTADQDMQVLPVIVGPTNLSALQLIFHGKGIRSFSNVECELAKYTHNVFGAMKVTYFNVIHQICGEMKANYENVLRASAITGFIGKTHTQVPGPDGLFGYGGKCFPDNVDSFTRWVFNFKGFGKQYGFLRMIHFVNQDQRERVVLPQGRT